MNLKVRRSSERSSKERREVGPVWFGSTANFDSRRGGRNTGMKILKESERAVFLSTWPMVGARGRGWVIHSRRREDGEMDLRRDDDYRAGRITRDNVGEGNAVSISGCSIRIWRLGKRNYFSRPPSSLK